MALTENQLAIVKLYIASFNRAPEKGGFQYWSGELSAGKTFAQVVNTVFSLDIVKAIYPDSMPNDAFLTLIYINIFNKVPDDEGLAFWLSQLNGGRTRSSLVMDMINAGLATPDGTPGKAFIVNRYLVAQYAVEQQLEKNSEIGIDTLKLILANVTENSTSVPTAKTAIDLDNSGGLIAPTRPIAIAAAVNGINPTEKAAGVAVVVNLTGTNAVAGNIVELLINGMPFSTPITRTLTSADITAKSASLTIGNTAVWGSDGVKLIAARIKDTVGHASPAGGALSVTLDTTAPGAPTNAVTVAAATNAISTVEKNAGVDVVVNLAGTNAAIGDTVEILIDGKAFSTPVTRVLTSTDITAASTSLTIASAAGWGSSGNKTLTARVTDVAGNIGTAGGTLAVTLDTTAPGTPTNSIAAATNGINAAELEAGVAVVVNLGGTNAAIGDTVEVLIGGQPFTTPVTRVLTSADIGAKSTTLTITNTSGWGSDGTKVITSRITDAAGNVGTAGGSVSVVLDTIGPGSLASGITASAATNGISNAERTAGVVVAVDLTGSTASAGETLELLINGAAFTTPVTRVLTSGDINAQSASLTIGNTAGWGADGSKVLTARIRDSAGNASAATGSLTVTLDTTAPAAPSNAMVIPAATNSLSAAEKAAAVDAVVDLTGTNAAAGDTISILIGGVAFSPPVTHAITSSEVTANSATVSIPGTVNWGADGNKTLTARLTDVAGNVGTAGGSVTITLDTTAPGTPTSTLAVAAAAGGINGAEKTAGVAVVANLTGLTVAAGDTVEILIGGASFSTPVTRVLSSSEATARSATLTIGSNDGWGADGTKTLTARVIDNAGNVGNAGGSLNVVLDATLPSAPANAMSITAATNGISATERTAGVAVNVDLTGTNAVAGDTLEILLGGAAFTTPVTHVITSSEITTGIASVTISSTAGWGADGSKTLTARVTDSTANVGTAGGDLTVTLDTTAPGSPTNAIAIASAANGINSAERTAGVGVVVDLTGTNAAAGDTLELLLAGAAFATPVTHVITGSEVTAGSATVTIGSAAGWGADGNKTLTARVTDVAGNIGTAGGSLTVTLDTTAPATTSTTPIVYSDVDTSGSINTGDTFILSFNEATNQAISISDFAVNNGHTVGTGATATWNSAGTQLTLTLGTGTNIAIADTIILVGVADVAGNTANLSFTIV